MRASRPAAVALALLHAVGAAVGGTTVEFGVEERVRSEAWNEITDQDESLPDQRIQYRFRTRLWVRADAGGRFEFAAGLNNESRSIVRPDVPFAWDEVVFETLYAGFKAGERFSARIGRQNLMRGEGFVLFDGSALDGSRTAYFNAVALAWTWPTTKLELLAISNPSHDTYLPRFNDKEKPLIEWDEQAVGVYATRCPAKETTLEAYWFYKTETDDLRPPTNAAYQPDRRLHTIGARAQHRFAGGWTASGEFALQRGTQDAHPAGDGGEAAIAAWGGHAQVKKTFAGAARPSLALGYVGLSGDDPDTLDVEGWDPLFSRWPKWSELYIYTQGAERGPAYWTNLGMWQAELFLAPWKPLSLRATWYRMDAHETVRGSRFGSGTRRGDLYQVRADLAFDEHWKGHALYEHLDPGSFHAGSDSGYFLRFEVVYALKLMKGARP